MARHLHAVPDLEPAPAAPDAVPPMERDAAIAAIRAALKQRSGKAWSVRGGTGTSWGWIRVAATPRRLVDHSMTEEDRAELAELLGVGQVSYDGVSIPASSDYRQEYVARAQGHTPEILGKPYWD